jgi:hypothetical protein
MKHTEWGKLSTKEQKEKLIREIKNAVYFSIYSNVCYLLNFCGLSQEMADELTKHCNAIRKIVSEFEKEEENGIDEKRS